MKKLVSERKELNLKEGDTPYVDCLWTNRRRGPDFVTRWFPQGTDYQKALLDVVFVRARRSGMEIVNTVVDLLSLPVERAWRDDGLIGGAATKPSNRLRLQIPTKPSNR